MTEAGEPRDEPFANGVVPLLPPRHVGARVARAEDPRLLTGRGRYVADVVLPGELHAAFVRSPFAHARIVSIDSAQALATPGVACVWTGADALVHCEGMEGSLNVEGCRTTLMPLLAHEVARFVGEAVAVVVAESRALAEDVAELLEIEYEPLPAVTDPLAARAGGPLANSSLGDNVALDGGRSFGDVDGAFAAAAHVVEARYHTGRLAPAPLECRGVIASYDWSSGDLRVWTCTQCPHLVALLTSVYLGLPEHLIEVITPDTGGGFGLKAHVYPEELLLPLLARELDRPVKWIEDRRENLAASIHAHEQVLDIAYALDAQGRITAQRFEALGDGGAYHSVPWSMAVEPWCATVMNATGAYSIPALSYRYTATATNKSPIGAYRGVGYMAGNLAHEALADEAARALGLSAFEFRRRNVVRAFPFTNPLGITYDEGSWAETLDALEQLVDHDAFRERQRQLRAEGRYLGLGISLFVESASESTETGVVHGLPDTYHDTATVRMDPQGKVTVTTGLTTQGQGNRVTLAQIAADVLGVAVDDVTVRCGESTRYAYGSGTVGSRAGTVAGGAVLRAGAVIRSKLVRVAARMLEAAETDVALADGMARIVGSPERALPLSDVTMAIYFDRNARGAELEPSLEATLSYDPQRAVFSNGGHAFVVEVDIETGVVRVERGYAVEDCGTMINPAIVEGQIRGGMTQGIGAALLEELVYDDDGQLLTASLADYLLPSIDVVPRFTFAHLETPSSHTPFGMKGMGESGLIASPAAMLNAVNDALSPFDVVLRRLPLTPERILDALAGGAPA